MYFNVETALSCSNCAVVVAMSFLKTSIMGGNRFYLITKKMTSDSGKMIRRSLPLLFVSCMGGLRVNSLLDSSPEGRFSWWWKKRKCNSPSLVFICKRLWLSWCLRYWNYRRRKDYFSATDWVRCSCMLRFPSPSATAARALLCSSIFHYDSIKRVYLDVLKTSLTVIRFFRVRLPSSLCFPHLRLQPLIPLWNVLI